LAPTDVADFDEVSMYLRPLTTIAMAIDTGDEMIHSTLIVFITPVE